MSIKIQRFMTCGRLYSCDTLLERLAQYLQDVETELRQLVQEQHTVVHQRHLTRHGHLPPPISPTSEMVWCGARNGRVVMRAVRAPVRSATPGMRVVSMASAKVMSGRMVGSQ
jgi:hypothetical protein